MKKNYTPIIKLLKGNLRTLGFALACVAGAMPNNAYSQGPVYTFSTGGQTGPTAPTQAQITTAYSSTNLNGLVTVNGGIQSFTVPATGPYRITAVGAQGGFGGGYGASISGDYTLTAGTVLKILVGQTGTVEDNLPNNPPGFENSAGGGGGGSFVTDNANVPYVVAGGGGGNGSGYNNIGNVTPCCLNGMEASLTTAGKGTAPQTTGGTALANGGTNGSGGTCGSFLNAGGGAGFTGNGSLCDAGTTAMSFTAGGAAGIGGVNYSADGGFGGGGGCYDSGTGQRGGGGGGYSGGGGGVADIGFDAAGGGGGSYNSGANQTNSISTTNGNGRVIISLLCDVNLTASTSNSLAPAICVGSSVTLSTNAISDYSWSTGAVTNTILVSPTITTTYSVSGSSALSCSNIAVITVTVSPGSPTISITSNTPSICMGNTVTITASGALTYTYTNSGVTNAVSFTPAATAEYTVTGTNGCGTGSGMISVTVTPLPVTAATTSTLLCSGSPATLSPGGATTYTWLPGPATTTNYIVSPFVTTIYTVTGKTGNCSNTATVAINTNPLPVMSIAASTTVICVGDNVNMNVSGNATTYTWNPGGQNGTSISASPLISTVYNVSGRDANNCLGSSSKIIIVNPLPVITVSSSAPEVCVGGSATLTADGAATYIWGANPASPTVVVTPAASGSFVVVGTSTDGCHGTADIYVSIFDASITVSSNTAICSGVATNLFADGADTYFWENNNSPTQGISVSPTANTVYTVTGMVNNQAGLLCPAVAMVEVTVNPLPSITAVSEPTAICIGKSATLTTSGAGAAGTYTWASGLGNNTDITVSPIANLTYTVSGKNAEGCRGTATVQTVVSPCTGINTIAFNAVDVLIYPNPTNGEFTISSNEAITLSIMNELGQQVKIITLGTETPAVKVNNLANGVYFITGTNENGSVKQKIVIAK